MLAGSEGPGGIEFDSPRLTQSLGVVALALMVFSGGLDTDWASIRGVL
jgi:potassium/hydrogen antiporter